TRSSLRVSARELIRRDEPRARLRVQAAQNEQSSTQIVSRITLPATRRQIACLNDINHVQSQSSEHLKMTSTDEGIVLVRKGQTSTANGSKTESRSVRNGFSVAFAAGGTSSAL